MSESGIKVMENALTMLEECYIAEALLDEKVENGHFRWTGVSRMVAAIMAVVGMIALGSLSVVAYNKLIKDVKVENGIAYVGDASLVEEANKPEVQEKYENRIEYQDPVVTVSDGTQKWLTKSVSRIKEEYIDDSKGVNSFCGITTYTYADYKTAAKDQKMEVWFDTLPGEVVSIEAKDDRFSSQLHSYSIDGIYKYGNGKYHVSQITFSGNIKVHEDAYVGVDIVENERSYTNKGGVKFTLVDRLADNSVENFTVEGETKITTVLIFHDRYFGVVEFVDLTEKEMHDILDCFVLGEVGKENSDKENQQASL